MSAAVVRQNSLDVANNPAAELQLVQHKWLGPTLGNMAAPASVLSVCSLSGNVQCISLPGVWARVQRVSPGVMLLLPATRWGCSLSVLMLIRRLLGWTCRNAWVQESKWQHVLCVVASHH